MRLGIRGTLIVGLAGLLFAAGGIAAWVMLTLTTDANLRQVSAQLAARADALAAWASLQPPAELGARLAGWQDAELVALAVFDGQLRPRAGSGPVAAPPGLGEALRGQAPPGVRLRREADHPRGAGEDLVLARPVSLGGDRAALGLVFSLDAVFVELAARRRVILGSLLFDVLALLAFGAYLATRALVRPVRALTAATQLIQAGQGGAEQVPRLTGPAELEQLAEGFRSLISRLAAQRAELEATIGQLEAARDELVRSEKLATVGRLAAGVAHEIGNPLAAALGYVEYLTGGRADDALRGELLGRTQGELERIRRTVRQLLDFARPSAGRPEPVSLGAVARSAAELAGYHAALRQVTVAVEGDAGWVQAEPAGLRQVFVNLLLNAGQALEGVGQVTVRLDAPDGQARAQVIDPGPGVPAEAVAHLFEPFFTARPEGGGTGLGLAISLRIVEAAGGSLRLVSPPGGPGAVFELRLPTIAAPAAQGDRPGSL